jgi:lipid II:glycine glycyltransferase (peptidoglycan interpeptide bridge formation enzyme)
VPPIARRADDTDRARWDAFIASRPEADLLQAWGWGECTAMAGEPPYRILVEDGGEIQGVAQTLIRRGAFGRQIAYVPHGPVWDRSAANADRIFAWLAQGLRSLALKEKALVVKMDPRSEPGQAFDFGHLAAEHDLQPAQDLQAPTTRIVDLLDGGEELEASWHADARRLSKRAAREGTQVAIYREPDEAEVSVLHDLLADVAGHAEFRVRSPEFLMRLATEFAATGGWYLGIASVDGTPIAAMAFPRVADRAYYLYGALRRGEQYKHNYGSHAVMAEMLRSLAADGATTVDMWGVVEPDDESGNPAWKGFSDFKRTFGGTPLRHPGLYDLVTNRFWYTSRRLVQSVRGGISDLRP